MPDIGRWNGIDQLAESYNSYSPYAYVMNNPISLFDPDGRYGDMPDWMKTMWYMTPEGTNTSWSNTGTGSGFMNTGFSGSMTPSYMGFYSPIGSTVGYNGTGNYAFGNSGGISGNSGGLGEGYINIPTVYLTGNSSGWGKQAQKQFNAFMDVINENQKAFDWYSSGGKANWFFGAGATFSGIKGGLNAERMYGQGIRGGLYGNYALRGRNLSLFGKMPATKASMPISSLAKWGKGLGVASFGIGVAMDGYAWYEGEISGAKFGLNTGMGAFGTWVNPIAGILYFGVDSFYPENQNGHTGWEAYGEDYDDLQRANSAIIPGFITAPYGSQKF